MNVEEYNGQELGTPSTTIAQPSAFSSFNPRNQPKCPVIKQTPNSLKATVAAPHKPKGRISNQTKRTQAAIASIEEGSQHRLEELIDSKTLQVPQC